MKTKLFLLLSILGMGHARCQTDKMTIGYRGNTVQVKLERNDADGFDAYLTNLTDANKIAMFVLKQDAPVSDFIAQLKLKLDDVAPNYNFKINDFSRNVDNSFDYTAVINSFKNLEQADFEKMVKPKYLFAIAPETYAAYIAKAKNKMFLFPENTQFYFLQKEDDKKVTGFHYPEGNFTVTDDEAAFDKDFHAKNQGSENLLHYLLPEAGFNEMKKAQGIDDKAVAGLEAFYKAAAGTDDYEFIGNSKIGDNTYGISIKPNNAKRFFNIKVCQANATVTNCSTSDKIGYAVEYEIFTKILTSFMLTNFKEPTVDEGTLRSLYDRMHRYNDNALREEGKKEVMDTVTSLLKKIENLEPQYSGILRLRKGNVRVYRFLWTAAERDQARNEKTKSGKKRKDASFFVPVKDAYFHPEYATVRFFNNKAKDIVVIGKFEDKNKKDETAGGPNEIEFTVLNVWHSIPLRGFSNSTQFVPISPIDDDAQNYYLNYNDLFEYLPSESTHSYSARNNDYRIEAGKEVKIEQRKLADYFTAVIFSDFLGLNSENSNSLLQAEGRVKIPLWISNWKKYSAFSAFRADVNATLYNGFDDTSRFITPANAPGGTASEELTSLTVNNFDFIKYNNINAGIGLDLLTIELKGLSTEWSFGYGMRYYRAGVRYNITKDGEGVKDDERRYQLNALTNEIFTNFEIRPQLNFGADLNIGLNWINARGAVRDITVKYTEYKNIDDKMVLRLQLNLYSKLDPINSNDGIYARIGGFYHFGAKDFYPQIMVGYATNLTSFVNKFKKK